jgi:hypothetical protein
MEDKVIILTDMEHFKAYRVIQENYPEKYSIELITSFENIIAHQKMRERVSDRAGCFQGSGSQGIGGHGCGDPHRIKLEDKKRAVRTIAERVNSVLGEKNYSSWYFAAPKKINHEILGNIRQDHIARLRKNINLDLTKISKEELYDRFI